MRCILFNKPFRVLSKFTDTQGRATLADFIRERRLYPAGRLDYDSEGLLLLTDHGPTQARISDPRWRHPKTYAVQVEGSISGEAIDRLRSGVMLNDGAARAVSVRPIEEPPWLWPRDPPIRYRASTPTAWMEIALQEGRNRQVRRMSAAVGLPTLRLVRTAIGPWTLHGIAPGEWRELPAEEVQRVIAPRRGRYDARPGSARR